MAGGTTKAMAAPAVRRERHDAAHGVGFCHAPWHPRPGLFLLVGKEWADRNDLEQRGITYCLVSRNKEQFREERMGRVHLGDLKTSMWTDGLRQKTRDAFGR